MRRLRHGAAVLVAGVLLVALAACGSADEAAGPHAPATWDAAVWGEAQWQ